MSTRRILPRHVRENNYLVISRCYRNGLPLSVTQISKEVGLSRTTVNTINEALLKQNLIRSLGKGESSEDGGKKPIVYTLNEEFGTILCFHIKYDSIQAQLINTGLKLQYERILPLETNAPLPLVLNRIREIYDHIRADLTGGKPPLAIAVAVHGIVNPDEGIMHNVTNFSSWGAEVTFSRMLAEIIEDAPPVLADNWLRYRAVYEKDKGIARGTDNFVILDFGYHGAGAGIFLSNSLHRGNHFLAGEIGHTIIDPRADYTCYCGGRGCFQSVVAPERLVESALKRKGEFPDSTIFSRGVPVFETIVISWMEGDLLAELLFDEWTDWIAIGLNNILLHIDPELIILEGDFIRGGEKLHSVLLDKLQKVSLSLLTKNINLIFNEPETNATLMGAASFALDCHIRSLDVHG